MLSQEDSVTWEKEGFQTVVAPLLEIVFLKKALPDLGKYEAIITTSAMAIRALANLTKNRDVPLWCIGKSSALVAESLAFQKILTPCCETQESAITLLENLLQTLHPTKGPLLYLAGEWVHLDLTIELKRQGFAVEKVIVYQARPNPESLPIIQSLLRNSSIRGVTFYSQRTALLWKNDIDSQNLKKTENCHPYCYPLCLSLPIANIIQPFFVKPAIIASTTEQLIANLKLKKYCRTGEDNG